MIRTSGIMLLAACGLFVLYAEGLHWIALWNLLPLFMAGMAIARGTRAKGTSWAALTFASVAVVAIAVVYLDWVFDWGGTQTGSSTAGLIFIFLPIYSLLLGACGWAVAKIVERITRPKLRPNKALQPTPEKRRV